MDLIYADENGIDLGVILEYTFDMAFGRDENDFSITIDINEHCCDAGYFIYIEETEYGGLIDKISPNTSNNTVTYEGRTWHGILENKIIQPDSGEDYKIVSGEANEVLASLISDLGLSDLFSVSSEDSNITIDEYQFERYTKAYTGILDMLYTYNAKLSVSFSDGKVLLSAILLYNYADDEEWDSSQFDFTITKNFHPVNHMIGLGSGDLRNRNVIHIFTDENGGIMPYATTDNPISDSDYILDTSEQILFGVEEIADTYDYGNAATTENYVLLESQPSDWTKTYMNYYVKSDDDQYTQNEKSYSNVYSVTTSEPSDWDKHYANYFEKSDDDYKSVEGEESISYKLQTSKPKDWSKNYGNYYYYYSDGVTEEYKKVSAKSVSKYNLQTRKPSDWSTNYTSYFYEVQTFSYIYKVKEKNSSGIWKTYTETLSDPDDAVNTNTKKYISYKKVVKSRSYNNISGTSAPTWKKKKYYTAETLSKAPSWSEKTYYTAISTTVAPTWTSGTYYSESTVEDVPEWKSNTFYQLYVDNFADLVAGCIKRLKELNDCDDISISFDASEEYDINDIIGATENITGISVSQPITKKIVKIKNGIIEISYEIGE